MYIFIVLLDDTKDLIGDTLQCHEAQARLDW